MTFDISDLLNSSPLLLLTVAGLLLLLLEAFSRVRLVGPDYHRKLPAETSEAVAVPVPGGAAARAASRSGVRQIQLVNRGAPRKWSRPNQRARSRP